MLKIKDLGDGVRTIGLDRADKRNAIGVEMTLALEDVLVRTRDDPAVKAIVFHGIGGHFSAGMDMKDFFDRSTVPPDILRRARAATEHWRTDLLFTSAKPIVTAVTGYCFGGAMPILSASDAVFAAPDARFGMPEINFGFVPGAQIVKAVRRMTTPRALSYVALTGRPFGADQAVRWGFATAVDADPFARAIAFARKAVV
jgi:trans-feruloyl-CoA hydratase/vanillin synthase